MKNKGYKKRIVEVWYKHKPIASTTVSTKDELFTWLAQNKLLGAGCLRVR